jgi:hypothetical protein
MRKEQYINSTTYRRTITEPKPDSSVAARHSQTPDRRNQSQTTDRKVTVGFIRSPLTRALDQRYQSQTPGRKVTTSISIVKSQHSEHILIWKMESISLIWRIFSPIYMKDWQKKRTFGSNSWIEQTTNKTRCNFQILKQDAIFEY